MSDKRFAKVLVYSAVNTLIMALFIYTTQYETMMYFMVSTLVFNVLVSKEEAE